MGVWAWLMAWQLFSGLGTFYAFSGESSREYDLKRAEQEKEALQLCTRLLKNDYRDEMSQMLIQYTPRPPRRLLCLTP